MTRASQGRSAKRKTRKVSCLNRLAAEKTQMLPSHKENSVTSRPSSDSICARIWPRSKTIIPKSSSSFGEKT